MTAVKRFRALALPAVDKPAEPTKVQIAAMKALSVGQASEHQQRLAFDFIVKEAAGIANQSFRANDALGMAFMEGRRFVAAQIVTMATGEILTTKDDT